MRFEQIRGLIYKLDPETAHNLTEKIFGLYDLCPRLFNWMAERNFVLDPRLEQTIWGIKFLNPVGVAAGFDKNGTMVKSFPLLGFGWGEVGAITPRPQSGNPKPRVWRFPEWEAVQNSFGFNNDGVAVIKERLKKIYPFVLPIGANIGKNKDTPEERAVEDYLQLVEELKGVADLFVVNISSPNTPGLRDLLRPEFVSQLVERLKGVTDRPILLKLSPDMAPEKVEEVVEGALAGGVDGLIMTNTTVDYSVIPTPIKKGGISGKPLKEKSYRMLKLVAQLAFGKVPLVAVGGIDSAEEAYQRIRAGASLLQLYTPLIFKGPGIVGEINRGLIKLLERDGFNSISEAVGADLKLPSPTTESSSG